MISLYRCTRDIYKYDLSGQGAYLYGGRWNNKGTRLLYTAANASLAMLEVLVHIRPVLPTSEYRIVVMECDSDSVLEIPVENLPENWFHNPAPGTCQLIGDSFASKNDYLLLKLPSAIIHREYNYLVNVNHPEFDKINIVSVDKLEFDARLF